MNRIVLGLRISCSLLVVAGCGDDTGASCDPLRDALCTTNGTGTDARITTNRDARVMTTSDARVPRTPDAQVMNMSDGQIINTPDGQVVNTPDGGSCGEIPAVPMGPPTCTRETVACIEACEDGPCVSACLAQIPDCQQCIDDTQTFCPARNGCATQTSDLLCCVEQNCANAQDIGACVTASCSTESTLYGTCRDAQNVATVCRNVVGAEFVGCFPPAGDASVPDAAVMMDAGADSGVRECAMPLPPVPPNLHTFCEAGTRTCIASATTQQEFDACLAADNATPYMENGDSFDCDWCIAFSQVSCMTNNGCGAEYGALSCCAEDNSCQNATCVQTNCGPQNTAYGTCRQTLAGTCGDFNNAAFNPCF